METACAALMSLFFAGLAVHYLRRRDPPLAAVFIILCFGWGVWAHSCYVSEFVVAVELNRQSRILSTMDYGLKTSTFPALPPGFPPAD